ncbi:AAA family ATPase [Agriterribacter sp.]|uniref:AAA family ATPase n=1 Tax=Agriterribacter sp. TaxID=2821509 RepID=UPI002B8A46F3|nr:AAA family ATPase [Agriterribacter sp.]HRO45001.1 AAA family ATPase [Agriterribacter sp.]HRQ15738.1 AAA family ATPase [Agriterribacter sp.]
MQQLKKIVVIGPESTGKSTLCEQLAGHYKTIWCREYAREYLLKHGMDYTYDNLLEIAKGQIALEDKTAAGVAEKYRYSPGEGSPLLFIDTDMYVMKVWCEFVFNQCHQWIIDQIVTRRYDLYLLCNTDLPWTKDELREYPDLETRERLYRMYKDIMINQHTPWADISGDYTGRFEKAKKAVGKLFEV